MGSNRRKNRTRTVALLLIVSLCAAQLPALPARASVEDTKKKLEEAQNQKKETEEQKQQMEEHLSGLQENDSQLQDKLNGLNDDLKQVSERLEVLEGRILQKEAQIEDAKAEVEKAIEKENWQYECMKKRIVFMYEDADYAYLEAFFSADNFGDFLNKSDYIEQLAGYDRKMLTSFQEARAEREEKEAELEQERKELEGLKEEALAEQNKVTGFVKQTANALTDNKNQMAAAEDVIAKREAEIAEQNANIAALQKKLAEEIALSRLAAQSKWRNISEVTFAQGDRDLLAAIIYCEAGNQPAEGKLAVGAVVINRVLSSVFPDSVVGVIYQGGQFSPVASGKLALALANGSATAECYSAADAAMSGMSNVGNCVYFRQPIEGLNGIRIGGHVFY